jgi:hypothetical protein
VDRKPQQTPQLKSELKLTEFQTFVCDHVGDLMLNSGHEIDLINLLYAAMGHYYNRARLRHAQAGSAGTDGRFHQ